MVNRKNASYSPFTIDHLLTNAPAALARLLIKLRDGRAGPRLFDVAPRLGDDGRGDALLERRAAPFGEVRGEQEHPLPGRFEFVGEERDFGDVVGDGHVRAARAGEDREVARGGEVGAGESAAPHLQLDA